MRCSRCATKSHAHRPKAARRWKSSFASFGFERTSPLAAVLEFVSNWENKPITKTGTIGELLDYLEYFREARGAIPMPSAEDNAVRLMTAHCAKGLEFNHVFMIRANSNSFPFVL